ncbi:MAG TPA: hypothetical protein VFQ16_08935 [Burkholderiaceae bacterium]|nr:hypothetical protein [Burkholderiaceae bacterium]
MKRLDLPLPTIELPPELLGWSWPMPPFARRHQLVPRVEGAQPCCIETFNGARLEGQMEAFDPAQQTLRFRSAAQRAAVEVPFARFRRLTLTTPWQMAKASPDAPYERVRAASQERDYRAAFAEGAELAGRTLGHVREQAGWFLYELAEDGESVLQHFVPAASGVSMSFGRSVAEAAAERWAHTPEQLRAALAAQRTARLRSVGEALVELGLVTPRELQRGLDAQRRRPGVPLGGILVEQGVIDENDLQTALAFKMGYPLVDLGRFPLDPDVMARLPVDVMAHQRVLPLMLEGRRLVVAIDDLARIPALQHLSQSAGVEITPVLAPSGALRFALGSLPSRLGLDIWAENVTRH